MIKISSIFKSLCLAILLYFSVSAQTPSVNVNINILPPYSPFLSDWQSHPERVIVTLTLMGSAEPVPVQLFGRIESLSGEIRIFTSDSYVPPAPEILNPGMPNIVSAQTIIDLYNVDNLVFMGTDAGRIQRTGRLPDGEYRICIVVYRYGTEEILSGLFPICSAPFEIIYYDPPTLFLPECGGDIIPVEPQSMIFSWIPPPMAPPATGYTLKIVEVIPETRDPNDAMNSATEPPFFEQLIFANQYVYGPSDPPLVQGRTYAWRVTAADPAGNSVFRNDGNSEVCAFHYLSVTDSLDAPVLIAPDDDIYLPVVESPEIEFRWSIPEGVPLDTRFDFRLVEVVPRDRNLNDAINDAGAAIFELATTETYYDYGAVDPPLVPYRKYAWRVRASNTDETVYFRNGGYSETYSFHYGDSLEAPVLLGPGNGSTEPRPIELSWNGTPLPDGGTARYILKIMALGEGETPPAELPEDPSSLLLFRNITEQTFSINPDSSEFSPGTGFAWQIREYDPRPENRFAFYNNGSSEVWVCTVGRAFDEDGGDHRLLLDYPGEGERIPDRQPPFVAQFASLGTPGRKKIAIMIQELDAPGGSPSGDSVRFESPDSVTLPLASPELILNDFGPGGDMDFPIITGRWTTTPGSAYRWTLEIWPGSESGDTLRNFAAFIAAPVAHILEPRDRREVNNPFDSLHFYISRPTLDPGYMPGFAPGASHDLSLNVIIRHANRAITDTFFQQQITPVFTGTRLSLDTLVSLPILDSGIYRWFVETKSGDNVLVSDSAEFIYSGADPCLGRCVCLDPVFPEQNADNIPAVENAGFSIGFRPRINPDGFIDGEIRLWTREGTETVEETQARTPYFVAVFDSMSAREGGAGISIFDITMRNSSGDSLELMPGTNYMWRASINYTSDRIREDGFVCGDSSTEGGPFFFATIFPPGDTVMCNELPSNLIPQTDSSLIANELQIGGYTLVLNRSECTFDTDGRISGTGTVIYTGHGDWAVEFTNIYVNSSNQVVSGQATARIRDDIPAAIQTAIQNPGGMNAHQVDRLNELWHSGGTLLESLIGDRKVPFGFNLDLDTLDASAEGGWAFKATYVKMTFDPSRAYYDLVVGVRAPIETHAGEPSQWIGMYAQEIPFCIGSGVRWLSAVRLLDDISFGSPSLSSWDLNFIHSPPRPMPRDYTMQPGDGTALVISERGFEQLHIELQVGVPRTIMVPVRLTGGVWQDIPGAQTTFTGTFDIMRPGRELPDIGDAPTDPLAGGVYFIADLPPSRITGSNWRITSQDIVMDMSEAWSPTASTSPSPPLAGISTVSSIPSRPDSWKGLFIRNASLFIPAVGFPIGIQNAYSSSPLSFTAYAAPMIETTLGDDFGVRLDTIDFVIDRGNFTRARVLCSSIFPGAKSGRVNIEMAYYQIPEDPEDPERSPAEGILINVNSSEDQKFGLTDFMAFTINRGSQMEINYVDPPPEGESRWGFEFDISGGLELIKSSGPDTSIAIEGIEFEHFSFDSRGRGLRSPTITFLGLPATPDTTGGGSGGGGAPETAPKKEVAGFPVGLEDLGIGFGGDGGLMTLSADLVVALTGNGEGPEFGGSTGLELNGFLAMEEGRLQWDAPSLSLTAIGLDFESEALSLHGEINLYEDDPTWGDGFGGEVSASMAKMFDASAEIKFGKQTSYRYWFVKGDITLSESAAIPIGPLGIYGFLGGAYQHMAPVAVRSGESINDIRFEPTSENRFGVMAGVHMGVLADPSSFHAKVLLEARFLDANLTDINLNGRGWFMCELDEECNDADDSWAVLDMNMDFAHDRFHAVVSANINLLPLLSINAPDGSVDILFEPGNWHVYIGQSPFGGGRTVSARLLPEVFDIRAEGYAMIGNSISVNIGGIPIVGGGFATGISIDFHAGGRFLIFYGEVRGLFQAELAIIKLETATAGCLSGTDGWYALAGIQVELGLEVGIDVDLWLVSGRFEIFDAEIGMDVLVGGPNPTFLDGDARGSFSILDGLVSGSFHYHFHLGDDISSECISGVMERYTMPEPIVSISPQHNETGVSVFTSIGLGFALRENVVATLERDDGAIERIRFRLQQPLQVRSADGNNVTGTMTFSPDRLSAEWSTEEILQENTRYTITATGIGEVFRGGSWTETRRQVKISSFTTGARPRYITDPNLILFQYPLDRQRYSYVRGHENRHYIRMARNFNYLFGELLPGQALVAEYTDQSLHKTLKNLSYTPYSSGCGGFAYVENPELSPNTKYHVRFIKRTNTNYGRSRFPGIIGETNYNLGDVERLSVSLLSRARELSVSHNGDIYDFMTGGGASVVERRQGTAQSRVIHHGALVDTVLYHWFFRTGNYDNPAAKFSDGSANYSGRWGGSSYLTLSINFPEPVDDDLSALVFVRDPMSTSNSTARQWLDFLQSNDKYSRDYSALSNLIGSHDASIMRNLLITAQSRLRSAPSFTYFDASAPWQFNTSNYYRYRLTDGEITFENYSGGSSGGGFGGIPGLPGLIIPGGGSGGGMFGGRIGLPLPPLPVGYTDNINTIPLNAYLDFTSMRWRYRNSLTRPEASRISPASRTSIRNIGYRNWSDIPAGWYKIGLIHKSFNWKFHNRVMERYYSSSWKNLLRALRLESISMYGDSHHFSFGEFSCSGPGTIPFRMIFLEVR